MLIKVVLELINTIVIDLYNSNRDKKIFGSDAEKFNPDRETPNGQNLYGLSFGLGMHSCIGRNLAAGVNSKSDTDPNNHHYGTVTMIMRKLRKAMTMKKQPLRSMIIILKPLKFSIEGLGQIKDLNIILKQAKIRKKTWKKPLKHIKNRPRSLITTLPGLLKDSTTMKLPLKHTITIINKPFKQMTSTIK